MGLVLTFAPGTNPLPLCVGQPCVDAINNISGQAPPDGLCNPIGGVDSPVAGRAAQRALAAVGRGLAQLRGVDGDAARQHRAEPEPASG